MESLESQIAEWRAYVAGAPAVNGHDVDELEDHLRHQIAELNAVGLASDEAFLVADRVVERFVRGRARLLGLELVRDLLVLLRLQRVAPQHVDRAVLRRRHEPRSRVVGNTGARPLLERGDQRVLRELLREADVAHLREDVAQLLKH